MAIRSVSVSKELDNLIDERGISPSEAFRVGLCVILSDMGDPEYLNRINLGRKFASLQAHISELQTKLEKFESGVLQTGG